MEFLWLLIVTITEEPSVQGRKLVVGQHHSMRTNVPFTSIYLQALQFCFVSLQCNMNEDFKRSLNRESLVINVFTFVSNVSSRLWIKVSTCGPTATRTARADNIPSVPTITSKFLNQASRRFVRANLRRHGTSQEISFHVEVQHAGQISEFRGNGSCQLILV